MVKKNVKIAGAVLFFVALFLLFLVGEMGVVKSQGLPPAGPNTDLVIAFKNDLKLGDTGADVVLLQQILNKNNVTLVANDGPGSKNNETIYFGTLTKWAVIVFQELYREEILIPNGLMVGTGFVGPTTRAKLNSLFRQGWAGSSVSNVSPQTTNLNQSNILTTPLSTTPPSSVPGISPPTPSPFPTRKIFVYSTSKYQISPGSPIEVNGSGFSSSQNSLHIGDVRTIPLLSSSLGGTHLSTTIPQDLPLGKYEIWVTSGDARGGTTNSSKNSLAPIYVFVTNNPVATPVISSISPSPATIDKEITINGSGFSATSNNIYSSLGNLSNLSSSNDGKIIKVKISDLPQARNIKKIPGGESVEFDAWIYVQNENGVNKSPGIFRIKIL